MCGAVGSLNGNSGREVSDEANRVPGGSDFGVRAGGWTLRGNLTMRGQTRPVTVQVTLKDGRYTGATTVKQTDFGIIDAVSRQYPKAVVQSAEKRVHGETVEYVLRLKGATAKMVVLDSDGKIIRTK